MVSAMLNGEELVGAAVDFAKPFDNVPTARAGNLTTYGSGRPCSRSSHYVSVSQKTTLN